MRASSMSTSSCVSGGAACPCTFAASATTASGWPCRVDRKAFQLRVGRHVVAARPPAWVALAGQRGPARSRSRSTARRAPRRCSSPWSADESACTRRSSVSATSAVLPFEPAREARIGERAAQRRRRRQQARRPSRSAGVTPDSPRTSKRCASRRTSSGARRTSRPRVTAGYPRSACHRRRRVQRAAALRGQPRVDLGLAVGVARFELRETDRRLVQADVAGLGVEQRPAARRASRRR